MFFEQLLFSGTDRWLHPSYLVIALTLDLVHL
jgi:hypothetical protein